MEDPQSSQWIPVPALPLCFWQTQASLVTCHYVVIAHRGTMKTFLALTAEASQTLSCLRADTERSRTHLIYVTLLISLLGQYIIFRQADVYNLQSVEFE